MFLTEYKAKMGRISSIVALIRTKVTFRKFVRFHLRPRKAIFTVFVGQQDYKVIRYPQIRTFGECDLPTNDIHSELYFLVGH